MCTEEEEEESSNRLRSNNALVAKLEANNVSQPITRRCFKKAKILGTTSMIGTVAEVISSGLSGGISLGGGGSGGGSIVISGSGLSGNSNRNNTNKNSNF